MRNDRVLLRSRPTGVAQAGDFEVDVAEAQMPLPGEIMVQNAFLSVEPAMRGWIADVGGYSAPVPLGAVMRALAVGEIVASEHPDHKVGDRVVGWFGWQRYATVPADAIVRRIREDDLPLSLALGVLGINGVTAHLALTLIGEPKAGETVVVSTAAGAVGSAVGQIANILGCRTIGITRGPVKRALCIDAFGYEAALDYREDDLSARLAALRPNGIDVYFDNTAGPISDAVHQQLGLGARIVICGTASVPDWSDWPSGPRLERRLLVKRARMQGFVIFDHMDRYEESVAQLADWVREGTLRYREEVLDGIEACPDALAGLYRGENLGKRIIRI